MKDKQYISRKEQAILTKKKIFDTTALLMKKKGYSQITIREICQSANISIGTFYSYFLSKDDILFSIYNELLQDSMEHFTFDSESSILEQIIKLFSHFFNNLNLSFGKDLIREIARIYLYENNDIAFTGNNMLFLKLQSLLQKAGQTEAFLIQCEPEVLVHRINAFTIGHLVQWLAQEEINFTKMLQEYLQELERYLKIYIRS